MKHTRKFTSFIIAVVLSLFIAFPAMAVTTSPSLGMANTYGVLSSTYTNTSAGTIINADVGFTTPPAVAPLGIHINYGSNPPYATAGVDQGSALSFLNSQICTFTFPGGAINLSTDTTHGPIGVYAPGVYCVNGALDIGGPLNLNGNGTYIFRATGALTSTAGASVILNGEASACDVFWTPSGATTLAANTTFVGNILDSAGITVGANSTILGKLLAFGGTVTTDTNTISIPNCFSEISGTIGGGIPGTVGGNIGGTVDGGSEVTGTLNGDTSNTISGDVTDSGGSSGGSSGSRGRSSGGSVLGDSTGGESSSGEVLGTSTSPSFPITGLGSSFFSNLLGSILIFVSLLILSFYRATRNA